jgi:hypothetical protein
MATKIMRHLVASVRSWSRAFPGADGYQDVHAAATGVDELGGGFDEVADLDRARESDVAHVRGPAVGARPSRHRHIPFCQSTRAPDHADVAGASRIGRGEEVQRISRAAVGILAPDLYLWFWSGCPWTKCITAPLSGPPGECTCASSKGLGVRVPLAPPILPCQRGFSRASIEPLMLECSAKVQQRLCRSAGFKFFDATAAFMNGPRPRLTRPSAPARNRL